MQQQIIAPALLSTSLAPSRHFEYGMARVGRSTSWRLKGSRGGGIEIVSMRGLITGASLFALSAIAAQLEAHDASIAAVTFFNRAVFAATSDDLFAADMAQVHKGLMRNPRALIVTEESEPTFRRYAWLMAAEGIGRFAFTDVQTAEALRWAQAMGQALPSRSVLLRTLQA